MKASSKKHSKKFQFCNNSTFSSSTKYQDCNLHTKYCILRSGEKRSYSDRQTNRCNTSLAGFLKANALMNDPKR